MNFEEQYVEYAEKSKAPKLVHKKTEMIQAMKCIRPKISSKDVKKIVESHPGIKKQMDIDGRDYQTIFLNPNARHRSFDPPNTSKDSVSAADRAFHAQKVREIFIARQAARETLNRLEKRKALRITVEFLEE